MLALDKETFSYWVTNPEDLTPTDYIQLQESVKTYPYCQALHTLLAKAASIHQRSQTIPYVRRAAAHALSRNTLRKLIDNEFQWSGNLLSKLNELSSKQISIPEDYQQESYALFKEKVSLSSGFPKLTLLRWDTKNDKPEPNTTAPKGKASAPKQDDPIQVTKTQKKELNTKKESAPTVSPDDIERSRQFDLIENFIKNEPRIAQIKITADETVEQEDLTKRSKPYAGGLATESFAKILTKQGKVDKAIEIYKKLMVKNPEKKAYFAEKIAEITGKASGS